MNPELSELKQEVAALWSQYRQNEPAPVEDVERRDLAELNRSLEARRRSLADRSSVLRHELDAQRRRASRLSPVARVVGGFIGSLATAAIVATGMPALADFSVGLSPAHGATLISFSLLVVGLAVSRGD